MCMCVCVFARACVCPLHSIKGVDGIIVGRGVVSADDPAIAAKRCVDAAAVTLIWVLQILLRLQFRGITTYFHSIVSNSLQLSRCFLGGISFTLANAIKC